MADKVVTDEVATDEVATDDLQAKVSLFNSFDICCLFIHVWQV